MMMSKSMGMMWQLCTSITLRPFGTHSAMRSEGMPYLRKSHPKPALAYHSCSAPPPK